MTDKEILQMDWYDLCGCAALFMTDQDKIDWWNNDEPPFNKEEDDKSVIDKAKEHIQSLKQQPKEITVEMDRTPEAHFAGLDEWHVKINDKNQVIITDVKF